MTTKIQEVTRHLTEWKTITSWEASQMYGASRLSAIIFVLRKRGYKIINRWEKKLDRYGHNCRYVRYIYLGQCSVGDISKSWFSRIKESILGKVRK